VDEMFVISDLQEQKYPIKVWLSDSEDLEEECLRQTHNLTKLPFLHKWVALMPDTHAGMGMPIGGVIAADGVIIPNAVGVDIGCGMAFIQTNIEAEKITDTMTQSGSILQCMIGDIMRNIPLGFAHHKKKQECKTVDEALNNLDKYNFAPNLIPEIEAGYYQVGTLGGGNHFIELQVDDEGYVCIMVHSGSRHLGHKICSHFHNVARELNNRYHSSIPDEYRLAFLPTDTEEGQSYINYMNMALSFAYENRDRMMERVQETFTRWCEKGLNITPQYSNLINCHHNYAALEHHYGKDVWVHRKGAIRAREGEVGIVPGAMGSYSYIVRGKGNEESFHSCSHGAGRRLSRTKAKQTYSTEQVMLDLRDKGVVLGKHNKKDVAEEYRLSYKDIEYVIANELDLIGVVKRLSTLGVVKG
jgi:tRNA-splicing ligase RtcB (3'-phosphate/5'-hydroxy nucleic acid ligase)